jgi:hypothetical protein
MMRSFLDPMHSNRSKNTVRTAQTVSYEVVRSNELDVMVRLNWHLHRVTPYAFIEAYLGQGLLFTSDRVREKDKEER